MSGLCFSWRWLAFGAVLVMPACAPSSPPPAGSAAGGLPQSSSTSSDPAQPVRRSAHGACDASRVQGIVGQAGTSQLAESARQQAGARSVRVIGHDDMVTKEYDTSRLNLQLDEKGQVARVYCG